MKAAYPCYHHPWLSGMASGSVQPTGQRTSYRLACSRAGMGCGAALVTSLTALGSAY